MQLLGAQGNVPGRGDGTRCTATRRVEVPLAAWTVTRCRGPHDGRGRSGRWPGSPQPRPTRTPDILITDLMMPHLNGVELTRRIRQELPRTVVILTSSYTEEAYRLMASDSGADAFVSKRVISDALLPALRDVIARRPSGGSGALPPTSGGSSDMAVLP